MSLPSPSSFPTMIPAEEIVHPGRGLVKYPVEGRDVARRNRDTFRI